MKKKSIINNLLKYNIRSIFFNFKYLPFKQAIYLPVLISKQCVFYKIIGGIIIKSKIRTGMIQIGYGDVSIFDKKKSRTILEIKGKLVFCGTAKIGHGSKISINDDGVLELGENFIISAESTIVCHKRIRFGYGTMLSWDVLVIDSDLHPIYNNHREVINPPKSIYIGNNVWIGCRSTILKGVTIADGCIIAASTTIAKSFINTNVLLGGNPPKIIKESITWEI